MTEVTEKDYATMAAACRHLSLRLQYLDEDITDGKNLDKMSKSELEILELALKAERDLDTSAALRAVKTALKSIAKGLDV